MAFSPIKDIVDDFRQGKIVVLMDDEDRENEGDLVIAAEHITTEIINFMARYGRGLICLSLTGERCQQLQLSLMVNDNGSRHATNFTVSIEAAEGVTTGISAADRATTVQAAVKADAVARDVVQPGHIFPLMAQAGGVLNRAGHTEAAVDLARLAGLDPSGVICEILNEDGSMARLPELETFAAEHGLKMGTIADLIRYRLENESTVERVAQCPFATAFGEFRLYAYLDVIDGRTHLALSMGEQRADVPTLVRVHVDSGGLDRFAEFRPGYTWPVGSSLERIAKEGGGVVVLLDYPMEGSELIHQIVQYGRPEADRTGERQEKPEDIRMVGVGAQILADLGVGQMRLLGSPIKVHSLSGFGLDIVEYIEER